MRRILILFFCIPGFLHVGNTQVTTSAVPFILIPGSVVSNGMGQITTILISDDPVHLAQNPWILGLQSIHGGLGLSTYERPTNWGYPGLSLRSSGGSVSTRVGDLREFPFALGLGMGYSHTRFNLGQFARTGDSPEVISTFDAYETSTNYAFGIGLDGAIKVGLGMAFKKIDSNLLPFRPSPSSGKAWVRDYGIVVQVPLGALLAPPLLLFSDGSSLQTVLDVHSALSLQNVGDNMVYIDPAQADPLPRQVSAGISMAFALEHTTNGSNWTLFSLSILREANDILISWGYGAWWYQRGFGDLRLWRNLVEGKGNNDVKTMKGFVLNVLDIVEWRRGSFSGNGVPYSVTSGHTVKTSGVVRFLHQFTGSPWWESMANLVDLQYSFSEFHPNMSHPFGHATSFSGFCLVVHLPE